MQPRRPGDVVRLLTRLCHAPTDHLLDQWRAFCVCAGAVVGLAACTAEPPPPTTVTGDYSERPLSDGARVIPPSGRAPASPPSPESCGALASLRPGQPVTPDAMPPGGPLADIAARGRLIVGLDQNTNLLSFRNPDTGTLEGFEVDLAWEIARDIFGDPSKIEFRLLTSDGRFEALENDAVDVVVHATTITCERAQRVSFFGSLALNVDGPACGKAGGVGVGARAARRVESSYTTGPKELARARLNPTQQAAVPTEGHRPRRRDPRRAGGGEGASPTPPDAVPVLLLHDRAPLRHPGRRLVVAAS
ncbi:transporter substrate-binding domain-containing protein (plasmid) [Rhodococcus sp. ZPP]|nr:transporter substrate-binding domain-containing protein [Rhodococcus sp. ZPP]